MGNVLGYIGHGPRLVAMDALSIQSALATSKTGTSIRMKAGNRRADRWSWYFRPGRRHGVMVYAGKIIKDLGLEDEYTLRLPVLCRKKTATVCAGNTLLTIRHSPGICGQYRTNRLPGIRGQRGRMEIRIDVQGVSCHVRHQNVVITPFSKWVQFLANTGTVSTSGL